MCTVCHNYLTQFLTISVYFLRFGFGNNLQKLQKILIAGDLNNMGSKDELKRKETGGVVVVGKGKNKFIDRMRR